MSVRIIIDLTPADDEGRAFIGITSDVSGGGTLTPEEIAVTLEETLQGIRNGTITPTGRHRRDH